MTAASTTFRCPLCAHDVHVVMRRTGYCLDCHAKSERRKQRRDALLREAAGRGLAS